VIDGIRHEIRDGEIRVALSARIIPRRLLYAFVAAVDHHLDRDAITRALWACDYDPLRHASSLHSNIRRLRHLLDGTRLTIQTEENGYRLEMPPSTVVVSPNHNS
jgi:DNA-binding SARP family transcriptional activator